MQTTKVKLDSEAQDAPMTAKQAAAYMGVSRQTFDKYVKAGWVPVHRLGDGPKAHRRFFESELKIAIRNRCSDTPPASGGGGRRPDGLIG